MLSLVLIGTYFYKKNKSSEAFTLGNSNIPSWVIAMSILATFISSISYLALPGSAYIGNWNAFVFSLTLPIAALFAVYTFVPLYRKINSPSAYAFLENRFGLWARIYGSTMYLLTQIMRIGTILYLMALTINAVFGWDIKIVITLTGLIVMVYSLLGGILAVVWTDAMQGIILIVGAILCIVYIMAEIPGGPGEILELANENDKFSLGSFSLNLSESTFWVVFIYGVFINLQNYGIDQNYVQRYLASRTDKEAKKSAFWGGMLYIPVSFMFLFIGTSLFAFYHGQPDLLPDEMKNNIIADKVFPYFISTQLPVGLKGLLIASIFAAGMSTISTSYNSTATVILTDYYLKYKKGDVNEKQKLRVLYIATFTISIIGILIGIAMINVKSALDAWWKLAAIFSGGMLGLFLLAAFSKHKNILGPIIGVVIGLLVIVLMTLPGLFPDTFKNWYPFHAYLTIVFGTSAIFLAGFIIGYIIDNKHIIK